MAPKSKPVAAPRPDADETGEALTDPAPPEKHGRGTTPIVPDAFAKLAALTEAECAPGDHRLSPSTFPPPFDGYSPDAWLALTVDSPVSAAMEEFAVSGGQADFVGILFRNLLPRYRGSAVVGSEIGGAGQDASKVLDGRAVLSLALAEYLSHHSDDVRRMQTAWHDVDTDLRRDYWASITPKNLSVDKAADMPLYQASIDALLSCTADAKDDEVHAVCANVARLTYDVLNRESYSSLVNAMNLAMYQMQDWVVPKPPAPPPPAKKEGAAKKPPKKGGSAKSMTAAHPSSAPPVPAVEEMDIKLEQPTTRVELPPADSLEASLAAAVSGVFEEDAPAPPAWAAVTDATASLPNTAEVEIEMDEFELELLKAYNESNKNLRNKI